MAGDSAGELADEARSEEGRQASNDVVASVLAPLISERCRVLRDRCCPGGEPATVIDHVVIASAGVFVIEVRSWSGRIELVEGELRSGEVSRTAEAAQVVADATTVSELLDSWTGSQWSIPVWPVLCLAGEAQVGGWAMVGDAHVVDLAWVADFVQNLEPHLGPAHVEWAHDAMARHLRPMPHQQRTSLPSRSATRASAASPVVDLRSETVVELPAEPPNEPIVYLTRRRDGGEDRFYLRDEEGTFGGYLDLRSGETQAVSAAATAVLQQVLPRLVDGAAVDGGLDAEARGGIGRFLDALRGRRAADEIPLVVCLEWADAARTRLYAFRFEPGGQKTDLGWVDLTDRRTAAVESGVDPILRYCGDRYRSLAG